MKQSSYRDQDYAFGQQMLTMRMSIGLTQAGLAEFLGVSRHAVGDWEAGQSYPKAEHLKAFIALAQQQRVFADGCEEEEIRALWHAAHQKVLLDEPWLQGLLAKPPTPRVTTSEQQARSAETFNTSPAERRPRLDWGDAPDMPRFYGRERELATLAEWVMQERCRVVTVLGLGGIGKSALAISLMHQVASHFEVVLWRSLRDAPTCESLLEDCFQVLSPEVIRDVSVNLERRLALLLEQLRRMRVLLVLDNLETLLEEGIDAGSM